MTTNRLAKSEGASRHKSVFRAREWTLMARDKGLTATAEAWEKAHNEGWDEDNYCPLAAEEYRRKIVEGRMSGR